MKIEWSVETSWATGGYSSEMEIDESELDGMNEGEREDHIERLVDDAVAGVVSWGWAWKQDA
jgi:hypothetical protein